MVFKLPPLPYSPGALEPVLSAKAVDIHYARHQAKYVDTTNALLRATQGPAFSLEAVIRDAAASDDRKLFNNAAQAWNHAFFWNCMTTSSASPTAALAAAIRGAFGDAQALRQRFIEEGLGHFGSGWVWLAADATGLRVFATHDAGTTVTGDLTPLLVCDIWEHAYYLDHRSDRAGFLAQWWDRLANWDFAARQLAAHTGAGPAWTYPREIESYVPPVRDHDTFMRALEEAGMLLEDPPPAGTEYDRRFGGLLQRIAEYEPQAPALGQVQTVSIDLERRIRDAARQAALAHGDDEHHWSPMVGGDLRRDHPADAAAHLARRS